jgi:hypothetical protein
MPYRVSLILKGTGPIVGSTAVFALDPLNRSARADHLLYS